MSLDTEHGFPATNLIRTLLPHIGVNIQQNSGSPQLSSRFYFISNAYQVALQKLIQKVEISDTIDWQSFQEYTAAIPCLERLLLDFCLQNSETGPRNHLPPNDGAELAIIFIEKWDSDRKSLDLAWAGLADERLLRLATSGIDADAFMKSNLDSDALQILWVGLSSFDQDFYLPNSSGDEETLEYLLYTYQEARTIDDTFIIKALGTYFDSSPLNTSGVSKQYNLNGTLFTDVKPILFEIKDLAIHIWMTDPAITRIVIKTMMLVYIPVAIISANKPSQEWKDYMGSTTVWTAIKRLLETVLEYLGSSQETTLAGLESEWATVRDLLLKLTKTDIDTSREMRELLQLAANIRRPLHGRSVELVKMLYYLDLVSRKSTESDMVRHRRHLKRLMSDSISDLESARETVSDIKAVYLTDEQYKKQKLSLTKVLEKIGPMFSVLKLSNEWPEMENLYNNAVEVDETHLTLLKARLGFR